MFGRSHVKVKVKSRLLLRFRVAFHTLPPFHLPKEFCDGATDISLLHSLSLTNW